MVKNIGYNLTEGGVGGDTSTYNPNKNIIQKKRTKTLREKCFVNPNWRKNCSNGMKGIKKQNTDNMKKEKTLEHKNHLSISIKEKYKDPLYKQSTINGQKNRWEKYYALKGEL